MDVNFHGNVLRHARRAAGLPRARARPSDFRLVDRRQARHPVDERLQRHEGGAGGLRRVAAVGIRRHRHPHQRGVSSVDDTEFREAMERDFGHQVSGLGPKQSVEDVARAIVAMHPAAGGRGLSAPRCRAGSPILNAARAGIHRSAGAEVRPAARRRSRAARGSCRESRAPMSIEAATTIARPRARRRRARAAWSAAGSAIGCSAEPARTSMSRSTACRRPQLKALLERSAPSIPSARASPSTRCRRRRVAAAPRIEDRPRTPWRSRSPAIRTCRRRRRRGGGTSPSTPSPGTRSTDTYLDPFDGRRDLLERRVLRAVDARTFGDDSLRVLRGIQFAARFELEMDAGHEGALRTHSARRSARRTHLGRGREAAAARRTAVDRLRACARARRHRAARFPS